MRDQDERGLARLDERLHGGLVGVRLEVARGDLHGDDLIDTGDARAPE